MMPMEQIKRIPNTGTIIDSSPEGERVARLPGSISSRPKVMIPEEFAFAKLSFSKNPILAKISPNSR